MNKHSAGPRIEERAFLGLVVAATLAMAWITLQFFGAILWAVVAAIIFAPINDWLVLRMAGRKSFAAALTLLLIVALAIVPAFTVGSLLVNETVNTYHQLQSGQIDLGGIMANLQSRVSGNAAPFLVRLGIGDFAAWHEKLAAIVTGGLGLATQEALAVGQGAFAFAIDLAIMLYLAFFLLRDGSAIAGRIGNAVPLSVDRKRALQAKFTTVIRATIKGSVVLAIVQGALGGLIFWLLDIRAAMLWGVVMGFMALIPAIGTALVWVPLALFLLITAPIWKGIALILYCVFLIGLVDNYLRPRLVGAATQMPDYVVLISTLGGIAAVGINGIIVGPVIAAIFIAAWDIFVPRTEE